MEKYYYQEKKIYEQNKSWLSGGEVTLLDGCRLFTGVLSSDCKNESEKGIEVVNTGLDRKNIYLIY